MAQRPAGDPEAAQQRDQQAGREGSGTRRGLRRLLDAAGAAGEGAAGERGAEGRAAGLNDDDDHGCQ